MDESFCPRMVRRISGIESLRINTSVPQYVSQATSSSAPECQYPISDSLRASIDLDLGEVGHRVNVANQKSSPEILWASSSTYKATTIMAFRGRSSTKIRQIIAAEPFNVAKIVDGQPVQMFRYHELPVAPRMPCLPLSSNPVNVSELESPSPNSQSSLCLQNSLPPCLTIKLPKLTATTVEGRKVDPLIKPHRSVRTPPMFTREAQATLNETQAWKIYAEKTHKAYIKLSNAVQEVENMDRQLEEDIHQLKDKNEQLEEEVRKFRAARAAPSQQKAFAEHFKMLFERESKKVESLENELQIALKHSAEESKKVVMLEKNVELAINLADASTALAETLQANFSKRTILQRSSEWTESWSNSDEAKFNVVKLLASSSSSTTPSLDSSPMPLSSNNCTGWMTAAQILELPVPEDYSDLEVCEEIPSKSDSPILVELPIILESPTELPGTSEFPILPSPTFTLNKTLFCPTVPRISISPSFTLSSAASASLDWCPSLATWEWCSVPDLRLTDFAKEDKKRRRCSGRVFEGTELASFRLGDCSGSCA
ncbi:uncharacterized protein Bfra_005738 [Botrytis fragariae]|uniref:Uncharacterized protein n=1 Tax=Botrytis fragariae TaxID=1964551 RepID=A0A8H6ARN7_9HELO|nr:uncharacterized protein Bfra_005738 [Botrytis fragariae]KAF5872379.1 hypothetical protein Bfra_005738 [Botrytis fragariae]